MSVTRLCHTAVARVSEGVKSERMPHVCHERMRPCSYDGTGKMALIVVPQ